MDVKFRKVIKEVEETYYVASDGLEFDNEYKCREHENELAINQAKIDFDFKKVEDDIDKYYFDNDEYRVEIYQNGQSKLFENKTNIERRCEYSIYRSVVSRLVDIHKYEKHK